MFKNIVIGVLTIICIFFIVLSQLKATEAEKVKSRANELSNIAEANAQKANEQEKRAVSAAADAQRMVLDLKAELEKCKSGQ